MKKPISLVTGCAGFIGSHVAKELLAMGHEVIGLDDLSGGFAENVDPEVHFFEGSITDHDLVDTLFTTFKFDYVFHLAAYAAEGLSPFIRRFNYTNNLLGSVNLINASVNIGTVKCFVFTSSMAVYGSNQVPMHEDMIPSPEDPYGVAKLAVEMDLEQARQLFGLNYVIFRPHNVYGEHQNIGDRYRNVIGIFMNQLMRGESMTIFGDGGQTRAFSYISDVAPAIAKSIERPEAYNEVFNIGADRPYSVLELAYAVAESMGMEPMIKHLEERHEVKHAYATHDKAQAIFGDLITNVSLVEGLRQMANWCKKTGSQTPSRFGEIEIERKLYASWKSEPKKKLAA